MLSSTRCSERTNAEARWSVSNQTQRHCPIWIEMFDILTSLRQIKAFPCSKSRYKSKVCTVYTSTSEWCTSYSKIILLAWIWKFESSDFTGLNARTHERRSFWYQFYFEWGIPQSLNAWTHERIKILMPKNLRALTLLFEPKNAWTQMLLISILLGMWHISKFERMNARTHRNFDAKKFESSDFTVWTQERMNADAFGLNSIWNEAYLKVWTHERTNA